MRTNWCRTLALSSLASLALCGCGTPMQNCTVDFTVTPATATLDHTVANNAQQYTLNVIVPPGCPLPPLPAPQWSVSNTVAASITESGVASCKAAASTPITVSAGLSFPSANLICK